MAIELHHLHPGHDDELSRLKARIAELEKMNHDLEEERRWRKFPDEKPEEDVKVLVYTGRPGFMSIQTDVYTKEDGFSSTREPRFRTYGPYVTHWMPLPSAPKEDDTERRIVFKNPKIRIGTGRPEWVAEPGKLYFVITWEE